MSFLSWNDSNRHECRGARGSSLQKQVPTPPLQRPWRPAANAEINQTTKPRIPRCGRGVALNISKDAQRKRASTVRETEGNPERGRAERTSQKAGGRLLQRPDGVVASGRNRLHLGEQFQLQTREIAAGQQLSGAARDDKARMTLVE